MGSKELEMFYEYKRIDKETADAIWRYILTKRTYGALLPKPGYSEKANPYVSFKTNKTNVIQFSDYIRKAA